MKIDKEAIVVYAWEEIPIGACFCSYPIGPNSKERICIRKKISEYEYYYLENKKNKYPKSYVTQFKNSHQRVVIIPKYTIKI